MLKFIAFLFSLVFIFLSPTTVGASYNVDDFGAKGDGKTDSTHAFLDAWTGACGSSSPATIYVPPGSYLLGRAVFSGECKNNDITLQIDGTLVAPSDYSVLASSDSWLSFQGVNGVSINGGTLDGQGSALWNCKSSGNSCPSGARSLTFMNSKNIVVNGLSSID
ncbi:PREDICTED: polygalacturonase-like, partial [Nelumbo nucifera]